MIYHFKDDININNIKLKNKLKYHENYIFYPISINNHDLVIETPKLYIPFPVNTINKKKYITLFHNKKSSLMIH